MPNVSFDGVNKIIQVTLAPSGGEVELDVKVDVYSDWKEWLLLSDNSKFAPAIRAVGGDPISGIQSLGSTFFLINGWRIRPYEANHRFTLNGNLYTDPSGFSPVVATVGTFNVVVEYARSNLVDAVSTTGAGNPWSEVAGTNHDTGTKGKELYDVSQLIKAVLARL